MNRSLALSALAALLVAACDREPQLSTERLPVNVNYERSVAEAAREAGVRDFDRGMEVSQEAGRAPARYVFVARNQDRLHFGHLRSATPRELLAYVAQHPEDAVRYRRLCARGSFVVSGEGYRGHLAYSGDEIRGEHRLGVLRNGCRWALLVE